MIPRFRVAAECSTCIPPDFISSELNPLAKSALNYYSKFCNAPLIGKSKFLGRYLRMLERVNDRKPKDKLFK
jgi:hypothetical protein